MGNLETAEPTRSSCWHARSYKDAAFWRNTAARWDDLGNRAEADGDIDHAKHHREEAARCRDNARKLEAYYPPQTHAEKEKANG